MECWHWSILAPKFTAWNAGIEGRAEGHLSERQHATRSYCLDAQWLLSARFIDKGHTDCGASRNSISPFQLAPLERRLAAASAFVAEVGRRRSGRSRGGGSESVAPGGTPRVASFAARRRRSAIRCSRVARCTTALVSCPAGMGAACSERLIYAR